MARLLQLILLLLTPFLAFASESAGEEAHSTEGLIADLGWILILGAVVGLIFKKLKQPVVLGYILAGFLASPRFSYLPSITTLENIEFWAQVGIVVLMFTLGLEFSFKKLVNAGASAIFTAFIIITGMTFVGYSVGRLMGFSYISSVFLGGMLSMSSTTIILKAVTDLGLRQKRFANMVLAVLIIEDLFAVLMLVLLSSLAAGSVGGKELAFSIGKLLFYLIIWYVVGVWFIPTFFKKTRSMLNQEMLLVVSMGLCFGMAVLSVICGFSLELGAFIAGSIIAGTFMAERIEHVVQPVKDLFGAVFFISVGMMVNPIVIGQYWDTILLLALVVIVGMIIFGTFGMLITGQSLKVAMESGFSLTQIGEFSFIIASLGMSLGVLNDALYPIIVAVSVITIFTTPYFIRMADPAYRIVERHLPNSLRFLIDRYQNSKSDTGETKAAWKTIVVSYLWRIILFPVIIIAIMAVSKTYFYPFMEQLSGSWGHFLAMIITLVAMSPFLAGLILSASKKEDRRTVIEASSAAEVPLVAMKVIRYIIALYFVLYLISMSYAMSTALLVAIGIGVLALMAFVASATGNYKKMEQHFMSNLNERDNMRSGRENNLTGDLHLAYINIGPGCPFAGDRIVDSGLRRDYGVSVSSIQRGLTVMPLPDKDARIFPGDILGVIGTDEEIARLNRDIETYERESDKHPIDESEVNLFNVRLSPSSPLIGKTLATSRLRKDYFSMLLRVTREDDNMEVPLSPNLEFLPGDRLWLVGNPESLDKLK